LIVDLNSGSVRQVVIDVKGSDREVRIPMTALAIDAASGEIVVNMDREQAFSASIARRPRP
jgi:hypothetical protein